MTSPHIFRRRGRPLALAAVAALAVTGAGSPPANATDCALHVTVTRDYAGNGVYDAGIDTAQPGMKITLTDITGKTYTATTGSNGQAMIDPAQAGLTGTRFRVALSVPSTNDSRGVPYSSYLVPAPAGTGTGGYASSPTTLNLTAGDTTDLAMGVWNPGDWTPANPKTAVPIHSAMPVPALPGAVATFGFNDRVVNKTTLLGNSLGTQKQVGTIGGLAYQSSRRRLFGAAQTKAQAPYGTGGPGAIYSIPEDKGSAPTLFTTVPDAGTTKHAATYPVVDPAFFPIAGKQGLGDIELSPDEKTLYVVNLKTRQLLEYDATQPTATAPKKATTIPNQGCAADGDWRPWALSIKDGAVFVGGVCSAESAVPALPLPLVTDKAARPKLQAVVIRYNGTGFAPVYRHGLGFPRGQTITTLGTRPDVATHWNAWDSNVVHVPIQWSAAPALSRPQPILSDIAWDRDGSMILGFRDRGGDQMAASPGIYTSAGDINRACANGDGTFTWEGEGTCPDHNAPAPIGQIVNGPLIGGPQVPAVPELKFPKEYFPGDWFAATHMETAQGSLAYPLRQGKIASTHMDPNMLLSSGIGWYDSRTGRGPGNDPIGSGLLLSTVVTNGIGKANALGDLALMAGNSNSQVGQLVWYDADKDGVQDVDEQGLPRVTVSLLSPGGTVLATRTTSSRGFYYFGDADSPLVRRGATYTLKFDACNADTSGVPGAPAASSLVLSPRGVGGATIDSDAGGTGCTGTATVTMPGDGSVRHDLDAGVHAP